MARDILIRGGTIVDGSGNPWFKGDIGIRGDRIVDIGLVPETRAGRVLDAKGLIVCPGFVDIHSHSDTPLMVNPKVESMIRQGITTQCVGNCGHSPYPVSESAKDDPHRFPSAREFFAFVENQGIAYNIASLVGHGSVRETVMDFDDREPTKEELEEMRALISEAMDQGAFGLSTGLEYSPMFFSNTAELIALAEAAARKGGFYASHCRAGVGLPGAAASKEVFYAHQHPSGYVRGVAEAIEVGRKAGIPVQISHIESHYPAWGLTELCLRMVDEARAEGLDVLCDVPPYLWNSTGIPILLPTWAQEGGPAAMARRLKDESIRERIKREVLEESDPQEVPTNMAMIIDGLWDEIRISGADKSPQFVGMSLQEIAKARGVEPFDAVFDLIVEEEGNRVGIIGAAHNEADIRLILKHPTSMIECDAGARATYGPLSEDMPHPRAYGTFPLVFRKYVRGETRADFPEEKGCKLLSLEGAIKKMTSLPAQRLGLQDRGLIRRGMFADITIFDLDAIADRATYAKPHQYSVGINYVIVNGKIVIENGDHKGALPGKVLRGPSYVG